MPAILALSVTLIFLFYYVLTTIVIHAQYLRSYQSSIEHTDNEKHTHKYNVTIYIKIQYFFSTILAGNERDFIYDLEEAVDQACQAGNALNTQR